MKKILFAFWFAALLVGCATQYGAQSVLKTGDFPKAYSMTVNYAQWADDRADVAKSIIQETGGAKNDMYFRAVRNDIKLAEPKGENYFTETYKSINAAASDGLLTQEQSKKLINELGESFLDASATNRSLLANNELLNAFSLDKGRIEIAKRTLDRLIAQNDKDLNKFFPLYKIFKSENKSLEIILAVTEMQKIIKAKIEEPKGSKNISQTATQFATYVFETDDHSLDSKIKDFIDYSNLSRADFSSIEKVYPDFSASQISKRTIKINLETNGDEFTLSEIADELKNINDWIEIDPDATRKLNFVRLRLNEQRNPPSNNSEIIPDPDFGTLLFIPKNASVLVDFNISEYAIIWNFKVEEASNKKSKSISGSKKLKKIECRNIRYQNVFGGTGALYNFPNSRIQGICQGSAGVDFDSARGDVIKKIANEVNEGFFSTN